MIASLTTPFLVAAFALAVLAAPAVSAAGADAQPAVVPLRDRLHIKVGMTRSQVREMFGPPAAMLTPNVWVYFGIRLFNTKEAAVNIRRPPNCDTLLIKFAVERVSLIQHCESAPVRAFIAQQEKAQLAQSTAPGNTVPVARPTSPPAAPAVN